MTPESYSNEPAGPTPDRRESDAPPRPPSSSGAGGTPPGDDETQGYLLLRGLVIPLSRDKDTILGRDDNACDVLLVDERVSKQHAAVSFQTGRYFITDLNSLNGTYVNGRRIKDKTALVSGDRLRVRPYEMVFAGHDHPQVSRSLQRDLLTDVSKRTGHFSGLLKVVPVTDLVQLLNSTRQSGILTIQDEQNTRAKVIFAEGEIVAATYGSKMAEDAAYAVLGVRDGRFDFMPGPPPETPSPIRKKTLSLLLEGCRRIDEGVTETRHTLPGDSQKTRHIQRLRS